MGFLDVLSELKKPLEAVNMRVSTPLTGAGEGDNGALTKVTAPNNDPSFLVSADLKNSEKNDHETIKTQSENIEPSINAHEPESTHVTADQNINKRILSDVLGVHIWLVPDESQVAALRNERITEAIFTQDERLKLRGVTPEHLKAVHAAKLIFDGAKVVSSSPRRADRPVTAVINTSGA